MPRTYRLDVRGTRCPVPYVRAKVAVRQLAPGDTLHVLFTDSEAPVDLAALAHDTGLDSTFGDGEVRLKRPPRPAADPPRR